MHDEKPDYRSQPVRCWCGAYDTVRFPATEDPALPYYLNLPAEIMFVATTGDQ